MNPVVDRAISHGPVARGGRRDELDQLEVERRSPAGSSDSDSSTGRSGTIRPSSPAVDRLAEVAVDALAVDDRVGDHRRPAARRVERPVGVLGAEGPERLEDVRELDPALEGPVIARRDHRAVGDRVGVGDADLDHVRPPARPAR